MILHLPSAFFYSQPLEGEFALAACSNQSDCADYLAQSDSNESVLDMTDPEPIKALSEKLESVAKPLGQSSESVESISKPIETLSRPIDSVSEPLGSVSKPLGSVSRPIGSYSIPSDSLEKSAVPQPNLGGIKGESGVLLPDSAEGGGVTTETERSAVGGEPDSPDPEESLEQLFREGESDDAGEKHYDRIKGTRETYCKWKDDNGMIHIESGEKCAGKQRR